MRLVRIASCRAVILASALVFLSGPILAQSVGDPLTPPPDLGASGVPVPMDGTAIYGEGTPPPGYMAIPAPPSTCGGIAAVVRNQGFILIPAGNGTAQRYVRDERYCADDQVTKPAWLPTTDNPRCFIGYTCGEANNDGGN